MKKALLLMMMLLTMVAVASAYDYDTRSTSYAVDCTSADGLNCNATACTSTTTCDYANDNDANTWVLSDGSTQIFKEYNVTEDVQHINQLYLNYNTLGNESAEDYCVEVRVYNSTAVAYQTLETRFASTESNSAINIPFDDDFVEDVGYNRITFRFILYGENQTCPGGNTTTEARLKDTELTFENREECQSDLSNADDCKATIGNLDVQNDVSAHNVTIYLGPDIRMNAGNNNIITGDLYASVNNRFNIDNKNVTINLTIHPVDTWTSWIRPYYPNNGTITLNLEPGGYSLLWKPLHYSGLPESQKSVWWQSQIISGEVSDNTVKFTDTSWYVDTENNPGLNTTTLVRFDGVTDPDSYNLYRDGILQTENDTYTLNYASGDEISINVLEWSNWSIDTTTPPNITGYSPINATYNETTAINVTFSINYTDQEDDATVTWSTGPVNVTNITREYTSNTTENITVWVNDSEYSDSHTWNVDFTLYEPVVNTAPNITGWTPTLVYTVEDLDPLNVTFSIDLTDLEGDATVNWSTGEVNVTSISHYYNESTNETINVSVYDDEYSTSLEWNVSYTRLTPPEPVDLGGTGTAVFASFLYIVHLGLLIGAFWVYYLTTRNPELLLKFLALIVIGMSALLFEVVLSMTDLSLLDTYATVLELIIIGFAVAMGISILTQLFTGHSQAEQ